MASKTPKLDKTKLNYFDYANHNTAGQIYFQMSIDGYEQANLHRFRNELDLIDTKFFIPQHKKYNAEIIEQLKRAEKINNGVKVFKYVTYEQMQAIYVDEAMKKADLTADLTKSMDGYLDHLEFGAMADKFLGFRKKEFDFFIENEI